MSSRGVRNDWATREPVAGSKIRNGSSDQAGCDTSTMRGTVNASAHTAHSPMLVRSVTMTRPPRSRMAPASFFNANDFPEPRSPM